MSIVLRVIGGRNRGLRMCYRKFFNDVFKLGEKRVLGEARGSPGGARSRCVVRGGVGGYPGNGSANQRMPRPLGHLLAGRRNKMVDPSFPQPPRERTPTSHSLAFYGS